MRNFRQALASPHPVLHVPRLGAAFFGVDNMNFTPTLRLARVIWLVSALGWTAACATSLRNPTIAELQTHPARYQDRVVSVTGTVTSSWGVPLLPFRVYKVDDGTGEVTVVSQNSRIPARGEQVRVKGRVNELAVFGGQTVGLHLQEEGLYVMR